MSEENKNIDQLFSDAAHAEKAPQYDAAYWAEMNEMLNAREAKKRRFLIWAFGGSAAFAVLLFSLFALNKNVMQNQKRYVQEKANIEIENAPVDLKANTALESKEIVSIGTANKSESSPGTTQSERFNAAANQKELTDLKVSNGKIATNTEKISKSTVSTNAKNRVHSSEINSTPKKGVENISLSKSVENEGLAATLSFTTKNNLPERETGAMVKSTFEFIPKPKYRFYTKINGGLMENYKTSRPYESGLIDLSINAEANFNAVLIRAGIGSQLTTNADLIVSQRAKVYGFGVTNHQNDLSYQNLFDIYIPLEIGYQYKKSSFGVGAQANYLVTSSMDLNHYEDNILIKTEQYYGNTNGLNTFSTQGYVWFEQRFTPLVSCGLKVGTNISGRIKDDAYFNNSATTNPIYGQLSLRINFVK